MRRVVREEIDHKKGLERDFWQGVTKMQANHGARADRQCRTAEIRRVRKSGSARQPDDRQLLVAVVILDFDVEYRAGLASDQRMR